MNFRWTMRHLHRWGLSRRKLRGGFLHSKLGDRVLHRELWVPTRESLAKAWLVGMTITMIPFLPLQSFIAIPIAYMVGANIPVTFLLQYLSNPATAFIQLPACYVIGSLLLGIPLHVTLHQIETHPMEVLTGHNILALYLGAFVLGPLLGGIGYGLTMIVWRGKPAKIKPETGTPKP